MTILIPREYQEWAVDAIFAYFQQADGHPLVCMPTATGKSIVIGRFVQRALEYYPDTVVWCLTHVQELIEQNADKLLKLWQTAPLGIQSAALGRRDQLSQIMYGGLKTVFNAMSVLRAPDLILIDECHLLSPNAETVYRKLIEAVRVAKPHVKVIGLTATAWRLGQGRLTEGENALFTDIAIDMTSIDWFAWFVAKGYLVPPRPKRTQEQFQLAGVGIANGDYKLSELNAVVDKDDVNSRVCREMVQSAYQEQRTRGLIFCSGVDHSEHIAKIMTAYGSETHAVHLRTGAARRVELIKAHKAGEFPNLTNNNVLTTGYDDPALDWIGSLRPTVSTALWVQMLGRGTRPFIYSNGFVKRDCLVLDFAGNTVRLGPINDPIIPREKGKGGGEAPVKICENCGNYCHASVRICTWCNAPFEIETRITIKASDAEIFRGDVPEYKFYTVHNVWFTPHRSKAGNEMIQVAYQCGSKRFYEYLNYETTGFKKHVAHEWWRRFADGDIPASNAEALVTMQSTRLNLPTRVKVHINRTYPEIIGYEYQ